MGSRRIGPVRFPAMPGSVALLATLPDLVAAFLPGAPVRARPRARIFAEAATHTGAPNFARLHNSVAVFLGTEDDEVTRSLAEYAAHCAAQGVLPMAASAEGATRAGINRTVSAAVASGMVAGAIRRGAQRARHPELSLASLHPRTWSARVGDFACLGLVAATTVPLAVTSSIIDRANSTIKPLPEVTVHNGSDELFVHLVAAAAPGYLSSTPARAVVHHLPMTIALGLIDGNRSATMRIGRGAVSVEPGIAPDAVAVLDGGLEPVITAVGDALLRELRSAPVL